MFVFTTKFNRKRAVAIVVFLAVVLCAIIIIAASGGKKSDGSGSTQTAALSAVVKNNGQRVKFLESLGWEVAEDAVEEQEVVIPRTFTDAYKQYNELQQTQGFDLTKYGGVEATRYTYRVLNHPGGTENVFADIIVYRGEIIAGDVQSGAFDGFMEGLEYPKTGT